MSVPPIPHTSPGFPLATWSGWLEGDTSLMWRPHPHELRGLACWDPGDQAEFLFQGPEEPCSGALGRKIPRMGVATSGWGTGQGVLPGLLGSGVSLAQRLPPPSPGAEEPV